MSLETVIFLSSILIVIAYLYVGWVVWRGVRRHLFAAGEFITLEQERSGCLSALLPKFTVIVFWPPLALIAIMVNAARALSGRLATH